MMCEVKTSTLKEEGWVCAFTNSNFNLYEKEHFKMNCIFINAAVKKDRCAETG